MNAVERVRENFRNQPIKPFNYDGGYVTALDDVQAELDKEVSYDYESEIKELQNKCNRLMSLNQHHEDVKQELCIEKNELFNELRLCKAKLEMVELIFGGVI